MASAPEQNTHSIHLTIATTQALDIDPEDKLLDPLSPRCPSPTHVVVGKQGKQRQKRIRNMSIADASPIERLYASKSSSAPSPSSPLSDTIIRSEEKNELARTEEEDGAEESDGDSSTETSREDLPNTHRPDAKDEVDMSQRAHVLRELLVSERKYVKDLETLIKDYLFPLRNMMDRQNISSIFSNIETILKVNKDLLAAFEDRLAPIMTNVSALPSSPASPSPHHPSDSILISDIFLQQGDYLKLYTAYIRNQAKAAIILRSVKQSNSVVSTFLDRAEKQSGPGTENLRSLLIKPIQRVCKYPLLINQLLKCTPERHRDYDGLVAAFVKMQAIATQLENNQTRAAEIAKTMEIQQSLIGLSDDLKLLSPDRKFIKEGDVWELVGAFGSKQGGMSKAGRPSSTSKLLGAVAGVGKKDSSKRVERHLFLFSDVLVSASRSNLGSDSINATPLGASGGSGGSGESGSSGGGMPGGLGANGSGTTEYVFSHWFVINDTVVREVGERSWRGSVGPGSATLGEESKNHCFELCQVERKGLYKTVICCETEKEKNEWMQAIMKCSVELVRAAKQMEQSSGLVSLGMGNELRERRIRSSRNEGNAPNSAAERMGPTKDEEEEEQGKKEELEVVRKVLEEETRGRIRAEARLKEVAETQKKLEEENKRLKVELVHRTADVVELKATLAASGVTPWTKKKKAEEQVPTAAGGRLLSEWEVQDWREAKDDRVKESLEEMRKRWKREKRERKKWERMYAELFNKGMDGGESSGGSGGIASLSCATAGGRKRKKKRKKRTKKREGSGGGNHKLFVKTERGEGGARDEEAESTSSVTTRMRWSMSHRFASVGAGPTAEQRRTRLSLLGFSHRRRSAEVQQPTAQQQEVLEDCATLERSASEAARLSEKDILERAKKKAKKKAKKRQSKKEEDDEDVEDGLLEKTSLEEKNEQLGGEDVRTAVVGPSEEDKETEDDWSESSEDEEVEVEVVAWETENRFQFHPIQDLPLAPAWSEERLKNGGFVISLEEGAKM